MTEGRYFSLGGLFQTGLPQAGMPHALCPSKGKHAGAGQVFNEGVGNDGGSGEDLRLIKVAKMCLLLRRHSSAGWNPVVYSIHFRGAGMTIQQHDASRPAAILIRLIPWPCFSGSRPAPGGYGFTRRLIPDRPAPGRPALCPVPLKRQDSAGHKTGPIGQQPRPGCPYGR